jgi:hypothetical protein
MVNVTVATGGTSGPRGNSVLNGVGVPANTFGFDGDFYIDTTNVNEIFGPKASGVWPAPVPFGSTAKANLTATTSPQVTNDSSQGYGPGSVWVNTVTEVYYACSFAGVGAAVWTPILAVGTTAGTVAAGNDSRIVNALPTGVTAGGDLSGTLPNPTVTQVHLSAPLSLGQGGTGSSTQNFVDLTSAQNVAGTKTFTGRVLVPSPVSTTDAVNLGYLQGISNGLQLRADVAAATAGVALPANTYFNGSGGVGATLTANAAGVLVVDGYTVALNDRLIVKDEASQISNGFYFVSTLGTVSVPYVLTRTTDTNTNTSIASSGAFVVNGTVNKGSGWAVITTPPITIGASNIVFTQYSSAGNINVGVGLTQVGNTISLTTPVAPANLPQATASTYGVIELNTDLGGTATNPNVVQTHLASPLPLAQGGLAASTASGGRTTLGLGTSAVANIDTTPTDIQPLGIQSAGSTGQVADAGHIHPVDGVVTQSSAASTVVAGTSYGQASVIGTDVTYAREDHSHGTPSLASSAPATTEGIGQSGVAGTGTTAARSDHVHPLAAAGTPTTSAVNDSPSTGNATTFAASNHVHGREGFGAVTPLSAFNTSAVTGVASTISHSDHVHGVPALPLASSSVEGIVQLAGDLSGTAGSPTVAAVNGVAITGTPSAGQLISATSSTAASWQNPTVAGDLSGTLPNPTVAKVNGTPVTGTPAYGQAIVASSSSAAAWGVLPNFASTGLLTGAVMSHNTATSFNVSAGTGFITDYVTNPLSPTITKVTISAQTVTLTGAALTRVVTWWVSDASGNITGMPAAPTPDQRRTSIQLGITAYVGGTLANVISAPVVLQQPSNLRYDLLNSLGAFVSNGGRITANGANLSINLSSGNIFTAGYNYSADINAPDIIPLLTETAAHFFYGTQLQSSETAATVIDPTHYDVGGVVTAVPGGGGTATIQRIYVFGTNTTGTQILVLYGQNTYASLAAAVAAVGQTSFIVNPDVQSGAGALVMHLCITKQCTSLQDTVNSALINEGKFATP